MTLITVIFLGLVQGITEFLPISSSGHLVIFQSFFSMTEDIMVLDIALHWGTMLSIIVFYRKSLLDLAKESLEKKFTLQNPLIPLIIGCIPVSIIGLIFKEDFDRFFADPKLVYCNLSITALFLFSCYFIKKDAPHKPLNLKRALIIGLFQVLALFPGISRSGMTISSGLQLGLSGKDSTDFSFFMAVPLLFGAGLLEVNHLINLPGEKLKLILLGAFISFISGLIALKILISILKHRKFYLFAIYCFCVSFTGLLFLHNP